ncbi:MarR family winged helix-turn-helix transcriptional regulator [Streptococcus cameli]
MKENIKQSIEKNQEALHSIIVFRRAENVIMKKELETIRKNGLTPTQFGVLEILYNKGSLRIQDLIDKMLSTSGNMTVVIKNMIRENYITRIPNPTDRRACLISLTEEGKGKIEEILEDHYNNIGDIFSVLSSEEQEQLVTILKKFKP